MSKKSMGRIKIARASNTTLSTLTDVLPAGNPIYNKTSNYLYIGDGITQVNNLNPLTSNKIADSNSSVNVSDTISTASHPNDPYVSVKGKDLYVENNIEVATNKTIYTDNLSSKNNQNNIVNGKVSNSSNADNANRSYKVTNPIMFGNSSYNVSTFNTNFETAYKQLSQGIISQPEYDELINTYINNLIQGYCNPISFNTDENALNIYRITDGSIKKITPSYKKELTFTAQTSPTGIPGYYDMNTIKNFEDGIYELHLRDYRGYNYGGFCIRLLKGSENPLIHSYLYSGKNYMVPCNLSIVMENGTGTGTFQHEYAQIRLSSSRFTSITTSGGSGTSIDNEFYLDKIYQIIE